MIALIRRDVLAVMRENPSAALTLSEFVDDLFRIEVAQTMSFPPTLWAR